MGLRFRKSVKICDGLRLNFGKTGASVTVGSGPFKKTFNTNGNVTTTVGIPGTGIYWTETERRGSRNNRRTSNLQQTRTPMLSQQSNYQVEPAVDDYFKFLSSGGSDSPVELLKLAGVDLTKMDAFDSCMASFKAALEEFEALG